MGSLFWLHKRYSPEKEGFWKLRVLRSRLCQITTRGAKSQPQGANYNPLFWCPVKKGQIATGFFINECMIEIMFSTEYMKPLANFHSVSQTAGCDLTLLAAHDRFSPTIYQFKPKNPTPTPLLLMVSGESPRPVPHEPHFFTESL